MMANQDYIYFVMFPSRRWFNFGLNPHHWFEVHCVCKTARPARRATQYMARLPSLTHACHSSVALISGSQSPLLLLPAVTDWIDHVTGSQSQSWPGIWLCCHYVGKDDHMCPYGRSRLEAPHGVPNQTVRLWIPWLYFLIPRGLRNNNKLNG